MMDNNYMDFGSDTDGDDDENITCAMDSDEEERQENETLLKMMTLPYTKTKQCRDVDEFQAEMEAELDKRALAVESLGGMEHQKSLSRSSSSSSLQKMSQSPVPSSSKLVNSGKGGKPKKTVRFTSSEVPGVETTTASGAGSSEPPPPGVSKGKTPKEFYDSIYFDSDESEGEDDEVKSQRKNKREIPSNDDLLYDPQSDERDQKWIDRRRQEYHQTQSGGQTTTDNSTATNSGKPNTAKTAKPLPNSDAVLNCPACFTTLCLDCQRHEFYSNQYRAMFVMNCVVDKSETLRVPEKAQKGRKNKRHVDLNIDTSEGVPSPNDLFNPVKCKICSTQIAVYDSDEVYHFFNVLSSYA